VSPQSYSFCHLFTFFSSYFLFLWTFYLLSLLIEILKTIEIPKFISEALNFIPFLSCNHSPLTFYKRTKTQLSFFFVLLRTHLNFFSQVLQQYLVSIHLVVFFPDDLPNFLFVLIEPETNLVLPLCSF